METIVAKGNFSACNAITRKWEGGDVNHPDDPGGLTSRGVTAARGASWRKKMGMAPKVVTAWSDTEVDAFYRSEFWDNMNCEGLEFGVDLCTYDSGVNSGPSRGRKWLLASLGGDAVSTIQRMCAARLSFVQGLKIWKTFGKGWARRIAGIEASAVSMWLVASKQPDPAGRLVAEAGAAGDKAATQGKAGGAAMGGAVVTVGGDAVIQGAVNWWLVGGLGVAIVAVVVIFAVKEMQNRERAAAYNLEAMKLRGSVS